MKEGKTAAIGYAIFPQLEYQEGLDTLENAAVTWGHGLWKVNGQDRRSVSDID